MIFLDSSFLIACKIENDEHHKKSIDFLIKLIEDKEEIAISDYVFDEVVTVIFGKTKNLGMAIETGNVLKKIKLFRVDDIIFESSWIIFVNQEKTKLSFTDCTTISLMKKEGIKKLATFDEDFKKINGIEVVS
jgi:predicted nucleic acid-binding protein